MFDFLKICGMGLLYTILSPLFAIVFVLYLIYATLMMLFNLGKSIFFFFKGVNLIKKPMPEDIEAQRIIKERKAAIQNPLMNSTFVPNVQQNSHIEINSTNDVNDNMSNPSQEETIDDRNDGDNDD